MRLAPALALIAVAACRPSVTGGVEPDFHLVDVNPASARSQQSVSPRDYEGQVSAWYFGHSN
jgi:hypothetical protein